VHQLWLSIDCLWHGLETQELGLARLAKDKDQHEVLLQALGKVEKAIAENFFALSHSFKGVRPSEKPATIAADARVSPRAFEARIEKKMNLVLSSLFYEVPTDSLPGTPRFGVLGSPRY